LLTITLLTLVVGFSNAQTSSGKAAHKTAFAKRHGKSKHHRAKKTSWKRHGQQGIAPDRAREIQEALVREHYLSGEPSGIWDASTQAALVRYQGNHGWQTKVVPDSRALIKLGLGPNYSQAELLNAPQQTDAVATAGATSIQGATAATDKQ
jgi:putative peptidoglycan binding protein